LKPIRPSGPLPAHLRFLPVAFLGVLLSLALSSPSEAGAQGTPTPGLAAAQLAAEAAEVEALRNGWNVTILITDAGGVPVYVRRLDGASDRSWEFALGKARTVALAGMSTADYIAGLAAGTVEPVPDAVEIIGGLPLLVGDQMVGAIAVSGVPPDQDLIVAEAGAAAFHR